MFMTLNFVGRWHFASLVLEPKIYFIACSTVKSTHRRASGTAQTFKMCFYAHFS